MLFWNGYYFLILDQSGLSKPKESSSEAFDNIENIETLVISSEDISKNDIRVEKLIEIKHLAHWKNFVISYALWFKNILAANIRKILYTKIFISTKEIMQFSNAGVDFSASFYIKDIYEQNDQMFKCYVC